MVVVEGVRRDELMVRQLVVVPCCVAVDSAEMGFLMSCSNNVKRLMSSPNKTGCAKLGNTVWMMMACLALNISDCCACLLALGHHTPLQIRLPTSTTQLFDHSLPLQEFI